MRTNNKFNRRTFIKTVFIVFTASLGVAFRGFGGKKFIIMSVKGPLDPASIGSTLIHEHILVDFVGAEQIHPGRWKHEEVIKKVLPLLREAKSAGCLTLVDCTPNFLGRDVVLLQKLSDLSGLNIITNTGYYGGSDTKFLPVHAFSEDASDLAYRWILEWKKGIDGTSVKPGFIKISVNPSTLSAPSKKLILAAGRTHLKTGLTIASHTGPAIPAFEQLEILKSERVSPEAFIWVHAQNETDWNNYVKAAKEGAWISLDGLNDDNVSEYINRLMFLKTENVLHKILVSHDAGWYDPAKPDGGELRGYTTLFKRLIPALKSENFKDIDIKNLIEINPLNAFTIRVRKHKNRKA